MSYAACVTKKGQTALLSAFVDYKEAVAEIPSDSQSYRITTRKAWEAGAVVPGAINWRHNVKVSAQNPRVAS